EKSGSAVASRGWQPFHVTMETGDGEIVGVVPMYLKGHSRGEYVFDGSWADAFERAGGRYYPKLQVSVPFTPATGRRLLTPPGPQQDLLEAQLVAGCVEVAKQLEVSSLHFTFLTEPQWSRMGELGLLKRMDRQFHWHNNGYATFEEFLRDLSSKKRKNIRRERRDACANGIDIEWITGNDLREHHWDAFYQFYVDTGGRKWGRPYLTRKFFSLIGEWMPEHVLLILCRRGGRYIAGAINFIGSDTLFGRNWGCVEDHPFLHFEACYYQAIDFAIERGLARVEAGAQGGHKLSRGYLPEPTYSAHWIRDSGFRRAVDEYLKDERNYVQEDIEYI
ncbi:MAG: GNAT family N-acetyltransferase, partial [Gammaproteobacteria bacterium]